MWFKKFLWKNLAQIIKFMLNLANFWNDCTKQLNTAFFPMTLKVLLKYISKPKLKLYICCLLKIRVRIVLVLFLTCQEGQLKGTGLPKKQEIQNCLASASTVHLISICSLVISAEPAPKCAAIDQRLWSPILSEMFSNRR